MAVSNFPEIKPSGRRFRMGDIPSTTYTSLSGAVFRRAFGNSKTNYTLDLTFQNIPDTNANSERSTKAILTHFSAANGTFSTFALNDVVIAGISDLDAFVKNPENVKWRYSKPPEVQSVYKNLSTVTVSLIAEVQA